LAEPSRLWRGFGSTAVWVGRGPCIPKLWVVPKTSCALNPGSAAVPGRHSLLSPCGTGQLPAARLDATHKFGMHLGRVGLNWVIDTIARKLVHTKYSQ